MPEQPPAYLWYPKDVLNSPRVAELSAAEECWYRRALDRGWLGNGVTSDPAKLAIHIGKKCTPAAAQKILDMFFEPSKKEPEKMVNETQEKIRKYFLKSQRQKSLAGKRGMENRWKRDKETGYSDNSVITPPITEHNNISSSSFSSSKDLKRLIDSAAAKFPKSDPRLIEIAIIETLIRRNGDERPIKSIAYFSEEIKAMCSKAAKSKMSDKTIDAMLERRRGQMAERVGS